MYPNSYRLIFIIGGIIQFAILAGVFFAFCKMKSSEGLFYSQAMEPLSEDGRGLMILNKEDGLGVAYSVEGSGVSVCKWKYKKKDNKLIINEMNIVSEVKKGERKQEVDITITPIFWGGFSILDSQKCYYFRYFSLFDTIALLVSSLILCLIVQCAITRFYLKYHPGFTKKTN